MAEAKAISETQLRIKSASPRMRPRNSKEFNSNWKIPGIIAKTTPAGNFMICSLFEVLPLTIRTDQRGYTRDEKFG